MKSDYHKQHEIYQLMVFQNDVDVSYYTAHLPNLDFVPFNANAFDVLTKNSSKAVGVRKLIEHLGYKIENTYAFGDGMNDIEMLQAVGTGIAMGNASDTVKNHADFVTLDVSENGLAHGFKMLSLI